MIRRGGVVCGHIGGAVLGCNNRHSILGTVASEQLPLAGRHTPADGVRLRAPEQLGRQLAMGWHRGAGEGGEVKPGDAVSRPLEHILGSAYDFLQAVQVGVVPRTRGVSSRCGSCRSGEQQHSRWGEAAQQMVCVVCEG